MSNAPRWRAGERVAVALGGRSVDGRIELASPNGQSVAVGFDALLGGYAGIMPVLWTGDGYADLVAGRAVAITPLEPRYACPLCGGVSLLLEDVANRYCPCCGADLLPKDCPHRAARDAPS